MDDHLVGKLSRHGRSNGTIQGTEETLECTIAQEHETLAQNLLSLQSSHSSVLKYMEADS